MPKFETVNAIYMAQLFESGENRTDQDMVAWAPHARKTLKPYSLHDICCANFFSV